MTWAKRNLGAHKLDIDTYGYAKQLTDESVSIDEKSFYLDGPCKTAPRCRWIAGERRPVKSIRQGQGGRVNLVMAVHLGGIVNPMNLPTTRARPNEQRPGARYLDYLRDVRKTLDATKYGHVQILYEDNCQIHKTKESDRIKQEEVGFATIELPPYSPDLNPIEKFFGVLTNKVYGKGRPAYTSTLALMAAIRAAIDQMNEPQACGHSEATLVFNSLMGAQVELWRELVELEGDAIPAVKPAIKRFKANQVGLAIVRQKKGRTHSAC